MTLRNELRMQFRILFRTFTGNFRYQKLYSFDNTKTIKCSCVTSFSTQYHLYMYLSVCQLKLQYATTKSCWTSTIITVFPWPQSHIMRTWPAGMTAWTRRSPLELHSAHSCLPCWPGCWRHPHLRSTWTECGTGQSDLVGKGFLFLDWFRLLKETVYHIS